MMLTFCTHLSLAVRDGDEVDLDLIIKFECKRGMPETGRFGPVEGYDPGSPDEIEIHEITLVRNNTELFVPKWLEAVIRADEKLRESLVAEALEDA